MPIYVILLFAEIRLNLSSCIYVFNKLVKKKENDKSQSLYASNNNTYTDVITINDLTTCQKCNFKVCNNCLGQIRTVKLYLCHETLTIKCDFLIILYSRVAFSFI